MLGEDYYIIGRLVMGLVKIRIGKIFVMLFMLKVKMIAWGYASHILARVKS